MKFKVGDIVKVVDNYYENIGEIGKVIAIGTFNDEPKYLVKFGTNCGIRKHNGKSAVKLAEGEYSNNTDSLWLSDKKIKKYHKLRNEINEVLYGTKTTIIKWSDGTQTEAVCSKDDEFDKQVGFAIAYTRKMNGGKLHE